MQADQQPPRVGLARAISKLGYCSRAQAAELIRAGRVRLNDALRRNPETPVRMAKDRITIDGRPLAAAGKVYLMLNKPPGVVTTADDEQGRDTVYSCLPAGLPWVAPVGRLDMGSEGLLLMTNDPEWAAHITAPESHLDKTYHVRIAAVPDAVLLEKMTAGVESGGERLRVKRISVLRHGRRNAWVEIVLDEGKNRQIRRILEALGIEVLRLVRVAVGPLPLGDLKKGRARQLTRAEKHALDRALGPRQGRRPRT